MKNYMCAMTILLSSVLTAAGLPMGEKIPLWPDGQIPDFQDHQIAATTEEAKAPGFVPSANCMPHLQWFLSPKDAPKTDTCMIVISGGGYNCCCDGPAFAPLVQQMLDVGIQCVNLTYRTPRPKGIPIYQTAWEDGQRAVRLVRSMAAARGFDPEKIGIIGMSAGGHLVTMLATSALTPAYEKVDALDDLPCHVNWCIANAPAYNTAR